MGKIPNDTLQAECYLPVSVAAEMLRCHFREIYALAEQGMLDFIIMPNGKMKIAEKSIYQVMRQMN